MSPLYEFTCKACDKVWEESQPVDLRDLPTTLPCPYCGQYDVARTVGCAGFQLKGYCWSRDNYSRTLGDDPRGAYEHQKDVKDA